MLSHRLPKFHVSCSQRLKKTLFKQVQRDFELYPTTQSCTADDIMIYNVHLYTSVWMKLIIVNQDKLHRNMLIRNPSTHRITPYFKKLYVCNDEIQLLNHSMAGALRCFPLSPNWGELVSRLRYSETDPHSVWINCVSAYKCLQHSPLHFTSGGCAVFIYNLNSHRVSNLVPTTCPSVVSEYNQGLIYF